MENDTIYQWGYNYIQDVIMQIMISEKDPLNEGTLESLYNIFEEYLIMCGVDPNDIDYLEFFIEKDSIRNKIKASNIVSAMWLCGFLPDDPQSIFDKDKVLFEGKIFKFNKSTNKLTWKEKG